LANEYYTLLNPKKPPPHPVLNEKGEQVVCHVEIAMNQVAFHALARECGARLRLLLDTNRPKNEQHFRDLTLRVYGGDSTTRIMQEILLGIAVCACLRALGVQPSVFHMNEGHAAFLTLELIREKNGRREKLPGCLEPDSLRMHFLLRIRRWKPATDRFSPDLFDYNHASVPGQAAGRSFRNHETGAGKPAKPD